MNNKEMIIMVGPCASGKTTYAKEKFPYHLRLNQDEQGKAGHIELLLEYLPLGADIVVDRMNFNRDQRDTYVRAARHNGYTVKVIVMHKPYTQCLIDAVKRPEHPTIKGLGDASRSLGTFFRNYERPMPDEYDFIQNIYQSTNEKEPVIVCDLDGTLCNVDHRLHFIKNTEKKDWTGFFNGITYDTPNKWCLELLKTENKVVFVSGRPSDYKVATVKWIEKNTPLYPEVYLRTSGDYRPDYVVKENILDFEILTRYTPILFIDDRKQVVDMWRRRGFICLQCNEGAY